MEFKKFTGIFLISFLVAMKTSVGLDLLGARESRCFPVQQAQLDMDWFYSAPFYFHMMNRYYLYLITTEIRDEPPAKIIEGSVYYDLCLKMQLFPGGAHFSGYGGTREFTNINYPLPNGSGTYFGPILGSGINGTYWVTLTDNRSFVVVNLCDGDNQMMWGVYSTSPVLPDIIKQQVINHVLRQGFKEEYFTELRYDTCPAATHQNIIGNKRIGWSKARSAARGGAWGRSFRHHH